MDENAMSDADSPFAKLKAERDRLDSLIFGIGLFLLMLAPTLILAAFAIPLEKGLGWWWASLIGSASTAAAILAGRHCFTLWRKRERIDRQIPAELLSIYRYDEDERNRERQLQAGAFGILPYY